jgi:hypothetical protein
MYEHKLSSYKKAYLRSPSQLNLVTLWHYKEIERRKEMDNISKEIAHILSHMELLGIKTHRSHDPKPKKSHSCKKLK